MSAVRSARATRHLRMAIPLDAPGARQSVGGFGYGASVSTATADSEKVKTGRSLSCRRLCVASASGERSRGSRTSSRPAPFVVWARGWVPQWLLPTTEQALRGGLGPRGRCHLVVLLETALLVFAARAATAGARCARGVTSAQSLKSVPSLPAARFIREPRGQRGLRSGRFVVGVA
jgi:hypothetical protein